MAIAPLPPPSITQDSKKYWIGHSDYPSPLNSLLKRDLMAMFGLYFHTFIAGWTHSEAEKAARYIQCQGYIFSPQIFFFCYSLFSL